MPVEEVNKKQEAVAAGKVRNDYLQDLLALQQDGSSAISAPGNWTKSPLLEVETQLDATIDEIFHSILRHDGENQTAKWHFFIGSPGNGKSAAMGKLCRKLLENGCLVRDESKVNIADLGDADLPYEVSVYENGNNYASARIVQDASVMRNPYSPDDDPASDLLNTLENAWEKGISLVICANRGILEKAHRDKYMDRDFNEKPWFKILKGIVEGDKPGEFTFDEKRPVFERVSVKHSRLDNRSLLLGADKDTFDSLLQEATDLGKWGDCAVCPCRELCPFKANRDWLAADETRGNVLRLLRRAEVFSGQVIVFREALALISFILAGCPKDYEGSGLHPCEWVQGKVDGEDIFSLATRRIYMCLFSSYCPHGLEAPVKLRNKQLDVLKDLRRSLGNEHPKAKKAMGHVVRSRPAYPSTDVGVTRLLGKDGVITGISPYLDALPAEFYERWDPGFEALQQDVPNGFGPLEMACVGAWRELEQAIDLASEPWTGEAYRVLRRWSSNFFLHLGALHEGCSAWGDGLDEFANLFALMKKSPGDRTHDDKHRIKDLNEKLAKLFGSVTAGAPPGTVQLSGTTTLTGEWVNDNLKPKTAAGRDSGGVSLVIEFGSDENAVLNAPLFLWLTRRAAGKLHERCFPADLMSGARDARARAAARGQYAFEDDGVEVTIQADGGKKVTLLRFEGDVLLRIDDDVDLQDE